MRNTFRSVGKQKKGNCTDVLKANDLTLWSCVKMVQSPVSYYGHGNLQFSSVDNDECSLFIQLGE